MTIEEYEIEKQCVKCERTSDLGVWSTPAVNPFMFTTLCEWCHADTEGLNEWMEEMLEKAHGSPAA